MLEIIENIIIVILSIAGLSLFFSPIMLMMYIVNKKQRKYLSQIAEKYNLEFHPGTKQIRRDFPYVEGSINKMMTYVQATTMGKLYQSLISGKTSFKTPIIKIALKLNNTDIKKLNFGHIKYLDSKTVISLSDFDKYFEIKIEPQEYIDIIFTDDIKQKVVEFCNKYKFLNFSMFDNHLITYLNKELTNEKRYQETVSRIELMHEIAKNI